MRWHPLVIRWSLATYQRVNPAGWAELRHVFNLPGDSSLRARKNYKSSPGIDHHRLTMQEKVCHRSPLACRPPANATATVHCNELTGALLGAVACCR